MLWRRRFARRLADWSQRLASPPPCPGSATSLHVLHLLVLERVWVISKVSFNSCAVLMTTEEWEADQPTRGLSPLRWFY